MSAVTTPEREAERPDPGSAPTLRALGPHSRQSGGSASSWLELLFDVVFSLAVTQLEDAVVGRHDAVGLLRAGVLLLAIWWAWSGWVFYADRFSVDDIRGQLVFLAAVGTAGVMAVAVRDAHADASPTFAGACGVTLALLVVGYRRAHRSVQEARPHITDHMRAFGLGAALWIASMFVPRDVRWWVWLFALAVQIATPLLLAARGRLLPVDATHLPERAGVFVLIVLGTSLVNIGGLVAGHAPGPASLAVATLSFVISASVWWSYFDAEAWRLRFGGLTTERGTHATQVVSAAHPPLVAALALMTVGEQMLLHRLHDAAAARIVLLGAAGYLGCVTLLTIMVRTGARQGMWASRVSLIVLLLATAALGATGIAAMAISALALVVHGALVTRRGLRSAPS